MTMEFQGNFGAKIPVENGGGGLGGGGGGGGWGGGEATATGNPTPMGGGRGGKLGQFHGFITQRFQHRCLVATHLIV